MSTCRPRYFRLWLSRFRFNLFSDQISALALVSRESPEIRGVTSDPPNIL